MSHTTIVAYVALFLALSGTGFAATLIGHGRRVSAPTVRAAAAAHKKAKTIVHVSCTAVRSGKRVACKVASGTGPAGPAGPRGAAGGTGPMGNPGPAGPSGPSTFTQEAGFAELPNPQALTKPGVSDPSGNLQWQQFLLYDDTTVSPSSPQVDTFQEELLSPSELSGSTQHLESIDFCWGIQNDMGLSGSAAREGDISITAASVTEYADSDGPVQSGVTPASSAELLINNAPLSITGTDAGQNGCQTVTAPSPYPAITPGGYLLLDLTVDFSTTSSTSGSGDYQALLDFGRVSATYTP